MLPRFPRLMTSVLAATLFSSLALTSVTTPVADAAANPVTPGNFTGYGFDQCDAPSQSKMTAWMESSPYLAAGIYISGASRACLAQTNLTSTWVATQLAAGWRLLPITLGPQASCTTRDRYLRQERINPDPTSTYAAARSQGRREARTTVTRAQALGLPAGGTLFYDLEAFDITKSAACSQSALWFINAWVSQLHTLGYKAGYYSSAASGMKLMDDERVRVGSKVLMPDQVWIADWNGVASTSSSYIRSDGWLPGGRAHQYRGGHNETYGGITINIDTNWVDLGKGQWIAPETKHCGGISINLPQYFTIKAGTTSGAQVQALKCRLREEKYYYGELGTAFTPALVTAMKRYQAAHGLRVSSMWTRYAWTVILTDAVGRTVKRGSAEVGVRRIQRALNAATTARLPITGLFDQATKTAVITYQRQIASTSVNGIANASTWAALLAGKLAPS